MSFYIPLMDNNITQDDLDEVISFLKGTPRLTQSHQVNEFEKEWSDWLGVNYSVFVNSGSSANLITLGILKQLYGNDGEIIVPTLTWVSDIAAVLQNGFLPVFVDINLKTLSMDTKQVFEKVTPKTKAVFITHAQGFNGLSDDLLAGLKERHIPLIEDVCEAHGATHNGRKLGSFGLISNFSFYFAHHMSTIEGGMICTNDEKIYQTARMYRSHGMIREMTNFQMREEYIQKYPECNPDFIFAFPAYNMRSTEINAVIGRNQLKHLDENNQTRINNFKLFLANLDSDRYQTDFKLEGSVNYAFNLVLKYPDKALCDRVIKAMRKNKIEFRRGSSGGGNQTRQPYLRNIIPPEDYKKFPRTEHVHFFGFYIGNFPTLSSQKILKLCEILNNT